MELKKEPVEQVEEISGVSIRQVISVLFYTSIAIAIITGILLTQLFLANKEIISHTYIYNECDDAIADMRAASGYLTNQARLYVDTGNLSYLVNYYTEAKESLRREKAIAIFESHDIYVEEQEFYNKAMNKSSDLEVIENHAIALVAFAMRDLESDVVPDSVREYPLTQYEKDLPQKVQLDLARTYLYSKRYIELQEGFDDNLSKLHANILDDLNSRMEGANQRHHRYGILLIIFVCIFVTLVVFTFIVVRESLIKPLSIYMECIEVRAKIPPLGCIEIQRLAEIYNELYPRVR